METSLEAALRALVAKWRTEESAEMSVFGIVVDPVTGDWTPPGNRPHVAPGDKLTCARELESVLSAEQPAPTELASPDSAASGTTPVRKTEPEVKVASRPADGGTERGPTPSVLSDERRATVSKAVERVLHERFCVCRREDGRTPGITHGGFLEAIEPVVDAVARVLGYSVSEKGS